jgi:hypothetical protein
MLIDSRLGHNGLVEITMVQHLENIGSDMIVLRDMGLSCGDSVLVVRLQFQHIFVEMPKGKTTYIN